MIPWMALDISASRFIDSSASHEGRTGKAGTLRGSEMLRQSIALMISNPIIEP